MNQTDQHTFADTDDQNATATSESMVEQTRQNYETFFMFFPPENCPVFRLKIAHPLS